MTTIQEPYLLLVPPVVDCILAVITLSVDTGYTFRAEILECFLISLRILLDEVHCSTEDVFEVAFDAYFVLKYLLKLLILHDMSSRL